MVMLYNLNEHAPGAGVINAQLLLHFVADSVKDWECNGKNEECKKCPWTWSFTRMPEKVTVNMCLLEGIKDQAFIYLAPVEVEDEDGI